MVKGKKLTSEIDTKVALEGKTNPGCLFMFYKFKISCLIQIAW